MKKILFYTDTPLLGGAENQMLTLARFLPVDQYRVTLACARQQSLNSWCQKFLETGIDIVRLKVFHKHDPRHFFYLKKMLPHFDLLHMHIWNPASGRYGFLAASKIPIVVTEHDPFPLKGIKGWLKKKLIARANMIITASQAAKKIVCGFTPALESRTVVIPNGIDIEAWTTASYMPHRNEFRRRNFGISQREKVILCVAELSERKGQEYLIEAFKMLAEDFPDLSLVLVGEGPKRKYYEELSKSLNGKIRLLGNRKEIPQLMAVADMLVLPSKREAFGLVLLEAAISGIPVIATEVGGIPEIIENGKTGLLAKPTDSADLARCIREVLQNPKRAAAMALNAKKRAEQFFNAKMMAARTAEVYDNVLWNR